VTREDLAPVGAARPDAELSDEERHHIAERDLACGDMRARELAVADFGRSAEVQMGEGPPLGAGGIPVVSEKFTF
jgi:hypothetical protein